jgi:hypothetical protein
MFSAKQQRMWGTFWHMIGLTVVVSLIGVGCCNKKKEKADKDDSSDTKEEDTKPAASAPPQDTTPVWDGTYYLFAKSVVNKNGKRLYDSTSKGVNMLTIQGTTLTYTVKYGPGNRQIVTQTYEYTKENIKKHGEGYDVPLVWKSITKVPTSVRWNPDSGSPLMKVRGVTGKEDIELEFVDTKGVRVDADFNREGKSLNPTNHGKFEK